jgi:uncharacterized protein (TIGR03437 family)
LLLLGAAATAHAYTHFVHYREGQGFRPIVEKFDLNALLDQKVYFYVAKDGPKLTPNDSHEALVSHIRQALSVWDAVPTSSLRVAYGGLTEGLPDDGPPAGEIVFAELPPGVIGLGGPITWGEPQGDFVPIVRSQVILSNDLTLGSRPRQSFSELFFNSLVHEIGHGLGLQHTLTSSAMSTDITRATSRAHPLGADDLAGLSALYPAARFSEGYGTISGRVVTISDQPVHLASVVAINNAGVAVSALTVPDGTYRIDGLLPGSYMVYAHPLPPATQAGLGPANMVLPRLDIGQSIAASGPFRTVFLGNTTNLARTPDVEVHAGSVTRDIAFRVTPTDELSLYGISTYTFPGNGAPGVHPAFLDQTQDFGVVLAYGHNLADRLGVLTVETLGTDLRARAPQIYEGSSFLRLNFDIDPFSQLGAKHLLFRVPEDIYVLPSALQVTAQPAPVIHWVEAIPTAEEQSLWSVHGVNFYPQSTVYFDGLPGRTVDVDAEGNEIQVVPPPGPPGHRAIVTVYNPDGQSSALTLPDGNFTLSYGSGAAASLTMSPTYIHAGTDRVVEIRGAGSNFVPGETVVGFGTSEVVARYVDVLSPNHLRAVVTVPPESTAGSYLVSVTSGLSVMTLPERLHTGEAPLSLEGGPPALRYGGVINSATATHDVSPGVLASLFGENFVPTAAANAVSLEAGTPRQAGSVRVTFNGQDAVLLGVTLQQINLQVPPSVEPGSAELRVYVGDAVSNPMLVQLARVSPGVFGVARRDNSFVQTSSPASRGETLWVLATGLGDAASRSAGSNTSNSRIQIQVGSARPKVESLEAVAGMPGLYRIGFSLPASLAGTLDLSLLVDGRRSNEIDLTVGR